MNFTLRNFVLPPLPKRLRIIVLGLLLACAGFYGMYSFHMLPPLYTPVNVSSQSKPKNALAAVNVAGMNSGAPQAYAAQTQGVAVAAEPLKAAPSSASVTSPLPAVAAAALAKGRDFYAMQEKKDQKDLELTLVKLDNDIKKEQIKQRYLNSNPETAFGGDVLAKLKKEDVLKQPDPAAIGAMVQPQDTLDKLKLIGIIGNRAVWINDKVQSTTQKGDTIVGYMVTRVDKSGVEIEKNGRRVTFSVQ